MKGGEVQIDKHLVTWQQHRGTRVLSVRDESRPVGGHLPKTECH